MGGFVISDTISDCYQEPLLFTITARTSAAPSLHYRLLIDWKRCLCTISLVDRDQYSATKLLIGGPGERAR